MLALSSYNPRMGIRAMANLREVVERLEQDDRAMDTRSYGELLRWCGAAGALDEGRRIHSLIARSSHWWHEPFLGNLLVQMYGSCESPRDAIAVFRWMPQRNKFSWNIAISATARSSPDAAREIFRRMPFSDVVSWTIVLSIFSHSHDICETKNLFDKMPQRCVLAWNVMVAGYARSGHTARVQDVFERMPHLGVDSWNAVIAAGNLEFAKALFDAMPERDAISWNTLLFRLSCAACLDRTKQLFDSMPRHGIVASSTMLAAFGRAGDAARAREIFDSIHNRDSLSWATMLAAYLHSGDFIRAWRFFEEEMPQRDVHAWSLVIAAYAQRGHATQAILTLCHMDAEGVRPDEVIFVRIFDVCGSTSSVAKGRLVHVTMRMHDGVLESHTVVGTALVSMYGRFSDVDAAKVAFDKVERKDLVTWTAMLTVYARNGYLKEAENLFRETPERNVVAWNAMLLAHLQHGHESNCVRALPQMELEGVLPNESTYITVLDAFACDSSGSAAQGRMIHSFVAESDLESHTVVATGLIHMYGKCGCLRQAREIFDSIVNKDLVAWAAMIAVYSRNGCARLALEIFRYLQVDGVNELNSVVFNCVLSACSSAGLIDDGREYFLSLAVDYGIVPSIDHYVCMVDLLGRSGKTDEADELLKSMPFEPHVVGWTSVMFSCGGQGDDRRMLAAIHQRRELETSGFNNMLEFTNLKPCIATCI